MSETVYCPIRKTWLAALPEELVRQRLISHMTQELGYPSAHLVIEKGLRQMPHLALTNQSIPTRRADVICFCPNIHASHALYPLLLVECKAVPLTNKVLNQVAGYNHFLQAYFIAVVNQTEVRTGWYERSSGEYKFIPSLPSYRELMQSVRVPKDSA